MQRLKQSRVYKLLKWCFFSIIYFILKKIGIKNWKYYYSKWIVDDGENALLTKYPLGPESTVVDVGGYTGNFSDKIVSLYNPHLIIFEPVKRYYKILKNKYLNNKKVNVYNHGLSDKNSVQKIYLSDDGTSLFKKSDRSEKIKLIDVSIFLKRFRSIDLSSINIEGAEYDVLKRLLETEQIKKIKFLQVQFHSFVPQADKKRRDIIKMMFKTHRIHFSYRFVWESFKLKR